MKVFVVFSALLAVASASQLYLAPATRLIVPAAASSQYHSQDGIGQYVYGYNDHFSTKQEVKSFDGTTKGSYSYSDSKNILQTVDYTADAGGFRVAATNLPKSVEAPIIPEQELPKQVVETSEVADAKSAHLSAVEEAKKRIGYNYVEIPAPIELPRPVEETPEVAAARAVHLAAIEEAKKQTGYQYVASPALIVLPRPVEDTHEVAAAKAVHLSAVEEAKKQIGYQYVASPAPIELPRPVEDTPEVVKAKAEHSIAIKQAKLRSSYQTIDSGLSLVQSSPVIASQLPLLTSVGSVPLPSHGFSYSSSVVNAPSAYGYSYSPSVVASPPIHQLSVSVPLPSHGFSYSSSVVNAPVSHYAYAPYVRNW